MGDYHVLKPGKFVGDQATVHEMVPSSVIASVPAGKAAAERYGREVRFDFLDDEAVQWMLSSGARTRRREASSAACLPFRSSSSGSVRGRSETWSHRRSPGRSRSPSSPWTR